MQTEDKPLFDWAKIKQIVTDPRRIRQVVTTLVPYIAIYIVFLLVMEQLQITPESVRGTLAGKGLILIPIFIGIQLLASLTPIPDTPLLVVGVLFFQPWAVFVLILSGMWLGSMINFLIARRLGRTWVQKRFPQTSNWIDRFTGKYGVETVIVARSFTLVTFDLVAYAAGISSMSLRTYWWAALLGLVPVAMSATILGIALTSQNVVHGVGLFALSLVLSAGFALIGKRINNFLHSREFRRP